MQQTVQTVARVNNVDIQIISNGEKRVAVKPICNALGIDFSVQRKRLLEDPVLNSVMVLSTTTGSDGKQYEMVTLPLKYVFGWLFRIDSRNVKEEAREAVVKYQLMCYDALYNYFTRHDEYLEYRQQQLNAAMAVQNEAKQNFNTAKLTLAEASAKVTEIWNLSEDQYFAQKAQLKLDLKEE